LLSKTLPELISLISVTALGVIVLPKNKKRNRLEKNITKTAQRKTHWRHSCPESRQVFQTRRDL
jgi:hypothetical protein